MKNDTVAHSNSKIYIVHLIVRTVEENNEYTILGPNVSTCSNSNSFECLVQRYINLLNALAFNNSIFNELEFI